MKADFEDLEIENWEPICRGSVVARFDLRLPCGITVRRFSVSQQDERRWLNLPAWKQRDPDTGKVTYHRTIVFDDDQTLIRFKEATMAALDLHVGGDR
jgi:hypothetical protein